MDRVKYFLSKLEILDQKDLKGAHLLLIRYDIAFILFDVVIKKGRRRELSDKHYQSWENHPRGLVEWREKQGVL